MLKFDEFEVLTFDCYGTLIDWENGILSALKPILEENNVQIDDDELLRLYARFESDAESGVYIKYREVLKNVGRRFVEEFDLLIPDGNEYFFAESLQFWKPFSDSVESLRRLKEKYKLGILSNVDRDLFALSSIHLEVNFDQIFTAEDIGSYKPSPLNFQYMLDNIGYSKDKILHVAQSLYHDIAVARSLDISAVWVNRRHDKPGSGATPSINVKPDLELTDLKTLVELIEGQKVQS